jgi:hypothetical protein
VGTAAIQITVLAVILFFTNSLWVKRLDESS